jgi:hypothetical protein
MPVINYLTVWRTDEHAFLWANCWKRGINNVERKKLFHILYNHMFHNHLLFLLTAEQLDKSRNDISILTTLQFSSS